MAISEKKLAANRANARRSTGPRTPAGKAKVARNALAHGLTARAPLLPHEDPEAYTRFARRLVDELRPGGAMQEELAGEIVNLSWKLRRAEAAEAELLVQHHGVWNASRDAHLGEPPGRPDIPEDKGDTEYGVWFHRTPQVIANMVVGNPPCHGGASPVWNLHRYAAHLERARASAMRMFLALQKRKPPEDEDDGEDGAPGSDGADEDTPNAERADVDCGADAERAAAERAHPEGADAECADAEQPCEGTGADEQDAPAENAPVQNKPTDPPAGREAQEIANTTDATFVATSADAARGESKPTAGASPAAARGLVREGG